MLDKIKNKHLLIDGDIVKYRCAASAEKTRYLVTNLTMDVGHPFENHKDAVEFEKSSSGGFIWSRKEVQPLEFALQACKTTLDALYSKLSPSRVSIFLSPERTFRHDLAVTKPYKGNRVQPKPKYLKDVEGYLINVYGAVTADGEEADDSIGRALSLESGESVSVSIDKDLLQVPGWHYNWVDDRIRWVSRREGDLAFYTQMLTGDATDNVPGLPGCGPASAKKTLDGVQSRADAATKVWHSYRSFFNDTAERQGLEAARSYFLEMAGLLWIKRGDSGYECPIELQ